MGQIANGVAKGERTYILKMQSGYDGSDRKWHGKGRKDVQPEDAERVQWVRSRMDLSGVLGLASGRQPGQAEPK